MAGIVVGVDGSPHSEKALDWALKEAALRQAPLTVLAVVPVAARIWGIAGQDYPSKETQDKIHQATQAVVDKAVANRSGLDVHVHTEAGVPADELVKASEGADLLVVAARGTGGFARLRIGAVSQQVAAHAHCPVTIVPAGENH